MARNWLGSDAVVGNRRLWAHGGAISGIVSLPVRWRWIGELVQEGVPPRSRHVTITATSFADPTRTSNAMVTISPTNSTQWNCRSGSAPLVAQQVDGFLKSVGQGRIRPYDNECASKRLTPSRGPFVIATHVDGTLLGPASLYPGLTTPAKLGETIVLYCNGFGPTTTQVVSGSTVQSGALSPRPQVMIGTRISTVTFAGLISPGLFQFNIRVPPKTPDGDQPVGATYGGGGHATGNTDHSPTLRSNGRWLDWDDSVNNVSLFADNPG
jgi:uncharacterized protein (TIGR03437 family)